MQMQQTAQKEYKSMRKLKEYKRVQDRVEGTG